MLEMGVDEVRGGEVGALAPRFLKSDLDQPSLLGKRRAPSSTTL